MNNKTIVIESSHKRVSKLPLSKVKQAAGNLISSSDYGSVSTIGRPRANTALTKDESTSDINESNNPVLAWKGKNSHHRALVKE